MSEPEENAVQEPEKTSDLAKDIHWIHHVTMWSQLGLGVIGIIALFIYYGQLRQMTKATRATRDAVCVASRTLSETQRSNAVQASFAKESLDATIDSFKKDQRAWLGAGDAKFAIDEKQLVASFVAKNVGKTPAIKVESNIGWAFKPQGHKLQTSDIVYPKGNNLDGTVFPTQTFQITDTLADVLPAPQAALINDLKNGKRVMYVFTKVEYRDVFNVSHWSHNRAAVARDLPTGNS